MIEISEQRRELYDLILPSLDFLKMKTGSIHHWKMIKFKSQKGMLLLQEAEWLINLPYSFQTVSIDEIESVRRGRQSEGLSKHTDTSLEDLCFSIFFKGRKKNLDLMASSEEEANKWVSAIEKVINNMHNLSRQQKSEQYP